KLPRMHELFFLKSGLIPQLAQSSARANNLNVSREQGKARDMVAPDSQTSNFSIIREFVAKRNVRPLAGASVPLVPTFKGNRLKKLDTSGSSRQQPRLRFRRRFIFFLTSHEFTNYLSKIVT